MVARIKEGGSLDWHHLGVLQRLRNLDHSLYRKTRRPLRSPRIDRAITVIYLSSAALLIGPHYNRLLAASIAALSSEVIKRGFNRRRPYERYQHLSPSRQWERSSSFPSSHSAAAFAAATVAGNPASFLAAGLLSGLRVPGGQHYPADVASGAIVGIGTGLVIRSCQKKK